MSRKEMEVSNLVACSTHRQKGTQKLTLKAASGGLLRSRKYSEVYRILVQQISPKIGCIITLMTSTTQMFSATELRCYI